MRKTNYLELLKKICMSGAVDLLIRFKAFIFIPILTKTLGASYFGIWTQIMITVNMFLPIVMLGMQYGFLRYLPGETPKQLKEDVSSITILVAATSILGSLLLFFLSDFISIKILGDKTFSRLVKISSAYLFTLSLRDLFLNYFRAMEKVFIYLTFVTADVVLSFLCILIIILLGYGIPAILWAFILLNIAIIFISIYIVYKKDNITFPVFTNVKKYLAYSLPFLPMIWLLWINNYSDRYFIGYFLTTKDVGVYSACYSISYFVINFISGPIYFVIQPIITRIWNNSNQELSLQLIGNLVKYTIFLTLPNVAIFLIISKRVIMLLTSPDFLYGHTIIPLILSAYLCCVIAVCYELIFFLTNKMVELIWVYLLSAVINLILNITLIPRIGILGAAIATFVSFFTQLILTVFLALKERKVYVDFSFLAKNIISALIVVLIAKCIPQSSFLHTIFTILIGIVSYFAISFMLGTLKKSELKIIDTFFITKIKV